MTATPALLTAALDVPDQAAALLRAAADTLEAGRVLWAREELVTMTGARCAVGHITLAANPRDTDGSPDLLHGRARTAALRAVQALADYLVTELGAPACTEEVPHEWQQRIVTVPDPVETIGGWNDESSRVVAEVVAAMRATADRLQHLGGAA